MQRKTLNYFTNDILATKQTGNTQAHFLLGPKLSLLGGSRLEILPGLVGLLDNLGGLRLVQELLIEPESVQRLVIRSFVPPEPLPYPILNGRGDVIDVVVLGGEGVGGVDGDDLPVELAVVYHGDDAEGLNGGDGAGVKGSGPDLDDVDGIVVSVDLRRWGVCVWRRCLGVKVEVRGAKRGCAGGLNE